MMDSEYPSELEILEEAAVWHGRLLDGACDDSLRAAFDEWLKADETHAAAFAQVESAYVAAKQDAEEPAILALRHEAVLQIALQSPTRRAAIFVAGAAAVVLCGLAVLLAPRLISLDEQREYTTAVGERLSLVLSDGSTAVLNTNTRLVVAYTPHMRRLILKEGQGFFEVAKGQKRPFVVEAKGHSITAHGTEFDVRIDRAALKVVLVGGEVLVKAIAAPTSNGTLMKPNELLVASQEGMRVSQLTSADEVTSWRNGRIVFKNDTLGQVVSEMNRYVSTPIVLEGSELLAYRVSGGFNAGQVDAFLDALLINFPQIQVSRKPDHIALSLRNGAR